MSKTKVLSTILIVLGISKIIVEAGTSIVSKLGTSSSNKSDEPDTAEPTDTVIEYNYSGEIET